MDFRQRLLKKEEKKRKETDETVDGAEVTSDEQKLLEELEETKQNDPGACIVVGTGDNDQV